MEAIQNIDFNFSNGAGGHSATVSTLRGATRIQDGVSLGTVIGDMGEGNSFSNGQIDKLFENFVCTEITTNSSPTVTSVSRKYADRTSLVLKSHFVLLRGQNCGPREDLDFEGEIPFFSEVINSPSPLKDSFGRDFPFPSQGPKLVDNGIIAAGRVYNHESSAEYNGIKISLVYNNRKLQDGEKGTPDLCLNDEAVSPTYKGFENENGIFIGGPDLQQYDLKYGYTLPDFKKMLSMVNVEINPQYDLVKPKISKGQDSNVLFETTGTLESVVSTVASYFGYFWFVNAFDGSLCFINTALAKTLEIDDYTQRAKQIADKNIVSATFTKSLSSNKIVNVYSGTAEQKEDKDPKDEDRPRKIFFKRYDILADIKNPQFGRRESGEDGEQHDLYYFEEEIAATFALFNQGSDNPETFDKFMFHLLHSNYDPINIDDEGNRWGMNLKPTPTTFGSGPNAECVLTYCGDDMEPQNRVSKGLYNDIPTNFQMWNWGPKPDNGNKRGREMYIYDGIVEAKKHRKSNLKWGPLKGEVYDRIDDKFQYIKLVMDEFPWDQENAEENNNLFPAKKMTKPSETDLYTFLRAFYAIAGGVYVSNGYSKYKTERMEFRNTNNLTIVGPVHGDTLISEIDDLSELWDILQICKLENRLTVNDLWKATYTGEKLGQAVNHYHFVAIRNLPKLERKNGQENPLMVDFRPLKMQEFYECPIKKNCLWLGGPTENLRNEAKSIFFVDDAISLSWSNWKAAKKNIKKRLPMEYTRSKTRVNKVLGENDDFEEEEDDELAQGTESENKMSDLFDRFDYRYFNVDAPAYNLLNNLSMKSFSGSVTEMKALGKIKKTVDDTEGNTETSRRTIYGLAIPEEHKPTMTSINIRVGGDGITTSISESTIKLIPPDDGLILNAAHEAAITKNGFANFLSATQKNTLGI